MNFTEQQYNHNDDRNHGYGGPDGPGPDRDDRRNGGRSGRNGRGGRRDTGRRPQNRAQNRDGVNPIEIKVSGFPSAVNKFDLLDLFATFGAVDAEIQKSDKGASRGFGYVLMPSVNMIRAAINTKNDTMYRGKNIEVVESRRRRGGYGYGGNHSSPHSSPRKSPRSGPNSPNHNNSRNFLQPPLLMPGLDLTGSSSSSSQPDHAEHASSLNQPSNQGGQVPLPEASFFFDPPSGTTSFRLIETKLGTTFELNDVPVHLEDYMQYGGRNGVGRGRRGGRGGGRNGRNSKNGYNSQHVLCHVVAMNSDEYNSTDLTAYGNDVGGGGSYQNVNVNSKGFNLSIEHFLSEACKYDAQITMHVSFGRIGLLVRLQSFVYFIF